jgi:hypothetical protein
MCAVPGSPQLCSRVLPAPLKALSGLSTPFTSLTPLARAGDVLHHLALPATVLAAHFATSHFLLMRAGMVSELGSDYLQAGRAKGLRDRVLKYRYAGRNALLPVVSLMAIHVGTMVTLTILVETVFRYEGLGRLVFDAIRYRDYPTLQGCFLLLTLMVVTANFLADLAYRRLDPRAVPPGCPFNPRCPQAEDICREQRVSLEPSRARLVACHLGGLKTLLDARDVGKTFRRGRLQAARRCLVRAAPGGVGRRGRALGERQVDAGPDPHRPPGHRHG